MTVTDEAEAAPEAVKEIGRDRRRKEDQRLITGRTRWTDNIQLNGMLHLAMVRSPFAHAKITHIEPEAAKAAPNVVTVVTGPDIADVQGILINAWPITPEQKAPVHTPVAIDRVTFAGEDHCRDGHGPHSRQRIESHRRLVHTRQILNQQTLSKITKQ